MESSLQNHSPEYLRTLSVRLKQIAVFASVVFVIRLVDSILIHEFKLISMLSLSLIVVALSLWLDRKGRVVQGFALLLLSMTSIFSAMAWMYEGLLDTSLYAFPGLLIMVGMLGVSRYFYGLLFYQLGFILLLGLGNAFGFYSPSTNSSYDLVTRTIDMVLILSVSGYSTWLIFNELQLALRRAKTEIEKATRSQEIVSHQSYHDALTDLPNRLLAKDRITQAIAQCNRSKKRVAMLYLDIDDFKSVNDSLGHEAGDEFLQQVAARLALTLRKTDVISRQGGDEFLIGLLDIDDLEGVTIVAGNILSQMKIPFQIAEVEMYTSCSIGIAVYPNDGADFDTLMRHADICMYQAKEKGRNSYKFYDEGMNAKSALALHMTSSLREGMKRGEFFLNYQPIIDNNSGKIVGAEALLRWKHPINGLISPADFIPIAERSGLIVELGEWVLDEACRQMQEWIQLGVKPFLLAVNLSTVQFKRGDIVQVVKNALTKSGLDPHYLELELTESTLIHDADSFLETLQRLKELGVRISIDDFGTGYSNLSYLQRFNVDKLKIDQSFVRHLNDSPQSLAIVVAIIQMAKSLNLLITAEGIEDEITHKQLVAMRCDQSQGYLFSRPKSADEFYPLLRNPIRIVA